MNDKPEQREVRDAVRRLGENWQTTVRAAVELVRQVGALCQAAAAAAGKLELYRAAVERERTELHGACVGLTAEQTNAVIKRESQRMATQLGYVDWATIRSGLTSLAVTGLYVAADPDDAYTETVIDLGAGLDTTTAEAAIDWTGMRERLGQRRRLRECVERWPAAECGAYDPRCCRWPKSCSATIYDDDTPESELEP